MNDETLNPAPEWRLKKPNRHAAISFAPRWWPARALLRSLV